MTQNGCSLWKEPIAEAIEIGQTHDLLASHLKTCDSCNAMFKNLQAIRSTLSSLSQVKLPVEFDQRFFEKLNKEQEPKKAWLIFFTEKIFILPMWSYATVLLLFLTFLPFTVHKTESDWALNAIVSQEIELYQNLEFLEQLDEIEPIEGLL